MDPKPTTHFSPPGYPTRREFLAKGTVFLLSAGCGGCGQVFDSHPIVAPIFEHGEGRAYMGCVVITSPVFLSEEEALQILKEELSKEGIALRSGITLAGVNVEFKSDITTNHWLGEDRKACIVPGSLDGVDRDHRVGVQFVSSKVNEKATGSWGIYNTPAVAKRLAEEYETQARDDLYIGIFYDPMETRKDLFDSDHGDKEAMAKSKELLRQQAQDFVAWLKKQQQG